MSSENFTLIAEHREAQGRSGARRLRRLEQKVPGTVYGADKDPESILIEHKDLVKALENEAVFSHILTLKIGDTDQKVVLKDLQRHPYKPQINHIDLMRIKAGEKMTLSVPIHFTNESESPAAKEGAVISHLISEVEIKCLPTDLPTSLDVDTSELTTDKPIHLSDITLPSGVELAHAAANEEQNQAIISASMPKQESSAEEEAPAEDQTTEDKPTDTDKGE